MTEKDAWDARIYKEQYHNRGRHLLLLYSFTLGTLFGVLLVHFW